MRIFGLIGFPLEHSFSERWFGDMFRRENIADAVYRNFPLPDIALLPGLLADNPDIAGLNVTSPYKETVLPYLDELSPEAGKIGAVNCIVRREGKLYGHNTDHYGFRVSLQNFLDWADVPAPDPGATADTETIGAPNKESGLRALILGSGGAAKAVKYALGEMSIPCRTVSRTGRGDSLRYEELTPGIITNSRLVINATPLGMYPDTTSAPPFPYELLSPHHYLYDLVYNPPSTAFLEKGRQAGAAVKNGYEMLVLQAENGYRLTVNG